MNTFPWTIFFILLAAGLISTAAVIPYSLAMNPKAMEALKGNTSETSQPGGEAKRRLPMPILLLISGLQGVVLTGMSAFLGLLAGKQVGLGTPLLQKMLAGRPVLEEIQGMLPSVLLLGLAAGIIMLVLEAFYFIPRIPRSLASFDARTAFWQRVLACFYGGIVEEILLRLFLMSSLVWLLGLVWKTPGGEPAIGAFWTANILAALLFGAGHLPATKMVAKLTPMVVARGLVLNGIPGLAFGFLYMTYGLEAAMLSHFSLDILIHLIAPPFMRLRVSSLPADPTAQPV
ncbi:MAG: CPBP family intramembrane metalloprotease [Chloroflexi bacterium]|nr:MAG: CPBP family intramembrane metalloprotease [Chloroflexota bacterium]